ncbi:hypothetical protein LSH36_324g03024 [Paralvinella palmiformis]|uniref:G-protein coupled receptors family 1 profile domain-containing protein n=1 Tax=Paralvinella palmiformis TaxID=53620 RepID=A0AAD9N2H2_9ANNE|nr:hypothetical protein LSH36_324g03024 [Paralvinella palmiformis]
MLDIGACCSQLSIPDIKLGWPAIFLAAVPLLSLATNGCMCAAIGHMKPPHKGGVSWLILSITVCDIVASATLMPLSVAKAHLGVLPGPWWVCDLWLYLALTTLSVVASHLCVLFVETCFAMQPPPWFSSLSHCTGVNLLKVGLAWLAGLAVPTAVMVWRESLTDVRLRSVDDSHTTWTEGDNVDGYASNASTKAGYNRTEAPNTSSCPWITSSIFLITACCYLLPLVISLSMFGVTWCRIQQTQKGVFVRGVRNSNSSTTTDRAVKEALLPTSGSIKENGQKASELAQKLTASFKRSNSSIRRSKRESSMQHRASVLDRHPSLRYSIKRQPSAKSETTRTSMRHSRKSSPNPSHSGLHSDHQALVAKLSWNSAVSDMDRSRSASPGFMEKVPICHSIADLISTHSTDPPAPAFQASNQQQNASYCNLYVEQNKGYNWSSSERLSQNDVTIHALPDQIAQTTEAETDDNAALKQQTLNDRFACGTSYHHSDDIPFADEPELSVPIILKDGSDDPAIVDLEPLPEDETQPAGSSPANLLQEESKGNPAIRHQSSNIDTDDPTKGQIISGVNNDENISSDRHIVQNEDGVSEHNTLNKEPSGLEIALTNTDDNQSINRNLLTASYHYESFSVSEQKSPSDPPRLKQECSSQGQRTRHTIHDVRYLNVTLGIQLLVHYLTWLPFVSFLLNNVKCKSHDAVASQHFFVAAEWTLYVGILIRPFLYIGFHLNLRKAFFAIMRCKT